MSEKFIPLFGYEIFIPRREDEPEGEDEHVMPIQGLYVTSIQGMGTITGYLTNRGAMTIANMGDVVRLFNLRPTPIDTE